MLLALLCSSIACGDVSDGRASAKAGAEVRGVVRDAESGERLSGVRVRFVSDTLEEASDKTRSNGAFAMSVRSESDRGRLEAQKAGYETRVVSVFLDADEVAIDLDLTPE